MTLSLRARASVLRRTMRHRLPRGRTALAIGCLLLVSSAAYTVERGDTLSEIAARSGTSVSALAKANDLTDPNLIHVGQRLTIPGRGGDAGSAAAGGGSLGVNNVAIIFDATGRVVGAHRKQHLPCEPGFWEPRHYDAARHGHGGARRRRRQEG